MLYPLPVTHLLRSARVRFPSALDALRGDTPPTRPLRRRVSLLPVAVVGSGLGGGCAPSESNYSRFFDATRGPAWEVDIREAGGAGWTCW